ncbi:MAG: fibronectin type III domain-containing protein, partial [Gemmatimonadales bacterium]
MNAPNASRRGVVAGALLLTLLAGCRNLDDYGDVAEFLPATGLVAVPTSYAAIELTWTAPQGAGSETSYRIMRGNTPVSSTTATRFTDEGLTPNTAYTYVVIVERDGKDGPPSGSATATTPDMPADRTPPSNPTNLTATADGATAIELDWAASTDDGGPVAYRVFRDGNLVATITGASYDDTGLSPVTTYTYTVVAADTAGNASNPSNPASATTDPLPDTSPPTTPTSLTAVPMNSSTIGLSWSASTDNLSVTGYRLLRDGVPIGTTAATSYQDGGLSPSTTYIYTATAYDAAGNHSAVGGPVSATTLGTADLQPPTAATSLTATATSPSTIALAWTAATDNIGVVGYRVRRGGTLVATTAGTSFEDGGRTPGTTYQYVVIAIDAAGNAAVPSNQASATTPLAPDTQAPTTPADLSAVPLSTTSIALSWTAAVDNVAVTGYRVFRGATPVTTVTGTTYQDNGLVANTTYQYRVAALDAAANESSQS